MNHLDRLTRAVIYAATAEPAFIGKKDYRWFTFVMVVNHDIGATDIGANVAAGAETGIDHHRHDRIGAICSCVGAHF